MQVNCHQILCSPVPKHRKINKKNTILKRALLESQTETEDLYNGPGFKQNHQSSDNKATSSFKVGKCRRIFSTHSISRVYNSSQSPPIPPTSAVILWLINKAILESRNLRSFSNLKLFLLCWDIWFFSCNTSCWTVCVCVCVCVGVCVVWVHIEKWVLTDPKH